MFFNRQSQFNWCRPGFWLAFQDTKRSQPANTDTYLYLKSTNLKLNLSQIKMSKLSMKNISKGTAMLLVLFIVAAVSAEPTSWGYKPDGTWKYSTPSLPEGYQTGDMIIEKGEDGYKVTVMLNEYYKVEAQNVVYKRKAMSFTLYVESEAVNVTGTFKRKSFTGTVSFSQGTVDFTAERK